MGYETARCIGDLAGRYNAAEDLMSTNLAAGRDGKTAIIDRHGSLTYPELAAKVDRMAGACPGLGLARGDRMLMCLLDTRAFPTAFLGAIKAGVIPVPLNTLLTTEDYSWILSNSDARAVLVSGDLAGKWQPIAEANPGVRFVSCDGGPWDDLETILGEAPSAPEAADTTASDTAFWLYTSGSTGRPKGTMHRHGSLRLTANLYGLGTLGMREDDVVLSVAKQFFAYGLGNALTFPYAAGATVVLHHERATVESIARLLIDHRVTVMAGVPT